MQYRMELGGNYWNCELIISAAEQETEIVILICNIIKAAYKAPPQDNLTHLCLNLDCGNPFQLHYACLYYRSIPMQ